MMPNEIATIFAAPTPPRMPTEPIAETINGFASTMQTAWDDLPDNKKLEFVEL